MNFGSDCRRLINFVGVALRFRLVLVGFGLLVTQVTPAQSCRVPGARVVVEALGHDQFYSNLYWLAPARAPPPRDLKPDLEPDLEPDLDPDLDR